MADDEKDSREERHVPAFGAVPMNSDSEICTRLTHAEREALSERIEELGLSGDREFLEFAINLADWVAGEAEQGRRLASISPNGKRFKEVKFDVLERIRLEALGLEDVTNNHAPRALDG